ncbi:hypothetical protein PGW91_05310 [Fusobacterium nucleatum]|nr:hypothetical protein [Fusobacterium nucleatum]WCB33603.1 hypothetical protein PGW91_05310 [Fusobacterium nucleatum]
MNTVYKDRYIVFIDILGFKDIVNKSNNDNKKAEEILENLKCIERIKKENDEIFKLTSINRRVTIFSDSIIISYPLLHSESGCFLSLVLDIIYITIELLDKGVYIRGGMTYGKLYHENNICFGPAMVEAYSLEQEAIYPRIIIDKKTIEKALESPGLDRYPITFEEIKNLIKIEDNIYYIDFLSNAPDEIEEEEKVNNFFSNIKKNITSHLNNKDYSEEVLKKYKWFVNYYNNSIERIIEEFEGNPHFFKPFFIEK